MLDGVSVLTTEKSIADHGISIATQSDCAAWRVVVDGEFCRAWEQGETMIAAIEPESVTQPPGAELRKSLAVAAGSGLPLTATKVIEHVAPTTVDAVAVGEVEIENLDVDKLANFETAAGGVSVVDSIELPTLPALDLMPESAPAAPITVSFAPVAEPVIEVTVVEPVRVAAKPARKVAKSRSVNSPEAGIYFVIGSFRNHDNAMVLAGRYERFVPEVLAAKLDGAPVYRVVVGPIADGREKTAHRRLSLAGLVDTWAIRVIPGDWQLASAIIGSRVR